MAQLAECCCTIRKEMSDGFCSTKELVRDENSKTRDLITANQIIELQRQLNDVKSDNSNLKQTNQIISALKEKKD